MRDRLVRRPVGQAGRTESRRRAWRRPFRSVRPVAAPDHSLRRGVDVSLGDLADVAIGGRPDLRVLVSAGKLNPDPAAIDGLEHQCERRVIDAGRLGNAPHVIEDNWEGRRRRRLCVLHDLVASIWIWICQPRSLTRFDSGSSMSSVVAPGLRVESDAANSEAVQPLELSVADACVDHRDTAGSSRQAWLSRRGCRNYPCRRSTA